MNLIKIYNTVFHGLFPCLLDDYCMSPFTPAVENMVIVYGISVANNCPVSKPDSGMGTCRKQEMWCPGRWDAKAITEKMVQMTELPFEILQAILTILAMSCDGAKDLARASATCKMLMSVARQPNILRVVSFQNVVISDGSQEDYHVNSLLFRCAGVGNLAAECFLGKALLQRMCSEMDHVLLLNNLSSGQLQHRRLVRSFIQHGSPDDIIDMRHNLREYIAFFAGLAAARQFCFRELFICKLVSSGTRNIETQTPSSVFRRCLAESRSGSPSPQERSGTRNLDTQASLQALLQRVLAESCSMTLSPEPRERLLAFFDRVFPPNPM